MMKKYSGAGFTLIELIAVILVLALLSVLAASRFIGMSRESKLAVLKQFSASVKSANQQMYLLSKMPSYKAKPVSGRGDLTDVDIDGDGVFETRLKCGYLDNTDVTKRLNYSSESIEYKEEGADKIYFGFEGVDIKASQCYFMYQQAYGPTVKSSCSQDDPLAVPVYQVEASGY